MTAPRILVGVQHFWQGWGGTPESILLFARYVADRGFAVDVLTRNGVYRDVAALDDLPTESGEPVVVGRFDLVPYRALYLAGAWNPLAPRLLYRARRHGLHTVYAPKGNLCRADFKRRRDLKKLAYLTLVEAPLIRACNALVLSSRVERDDLVLPRWLRPEEHVVAEPFAAPAGVSPAAATPAEARPFVLGFLAEIAPRKGLLELARAFAAWHRGRAERPFVLQIVGTPRPGAEAYTRRCREALQALEHEGFVQWLGARRGGERSAFYRGLDAFAAPSHFESYGLTPLEALAHGVPTICGPRIGVLEYLPESPAVIRLPDLGTAAFAQAFERLLEAAPAMREAAARARGNVFPEPFRARVTDDFLAALGLMAAGADVRRRPLHADGSTPAAVVRR